ncbi:unnamed protein product [Merluccius merluccius]
MAPSTFLHDVPPNLFERLCKIIDSGDDQLGWRGLAARIVPTWLEVRRAEKLEAAGKSPSRDLLWSWALQNTTVEDLVRVLEDMGHRWALQLFVQPVMPLSFSLSFCLFFSSFPVPNSSCSVPTVTQRRTLIYKDIIEGTRHFHHDMRIAEGRFSDIYKATLGTETFAVKLFKLGNDRSWEERWDLFTRETEVHHLFQHSNILDLLGCFSEDGNYCLVYPYLPNGSLHHQLHDQASGNLHPLTWQRRLEIIKGTAKAVHHLHAAPACPVICGNISSGNVLLDDKLQPQLSNFGLARLRPPSLRQSCTITTNSEIHDNLGYLPLEFIRDGKLSFSLDVYSFGMVVMETITGRKVVEETPKRSLLRDMLSMELENGGSVDSCMRFLDQEAGSWPDPIALSLLWLALECTAARQRSRPNMETVLKELSQLLPLPDADLHYKDLPVTSCRPRPPPPPPPPSVHSPLSNWEGTYDDDCDVVAGPESAMSQPCECSQSEVTFWSSCDDTEGPRTTDSDLMMMMQLPSQLTEAETGVEWVEAAETVDLYNSWPVQCSCQADSGELGCEDCRERVRASGVSYSSLNTADHLAKQTLKAKLQPHNQGVLKTEELLSCSEGRFVYRGWVGEDCGWVGEDCRWVGEARLDGT